jgi:hypothetical protein
MLIGAYIVVTSRSFSQNTVVAFKQNTVKNKSCVGFYETMLPNPRHLASGMAVWQKKWQSIIVEDQPTSALPQQKRCCYVFWPLARFNCNSRTFFFYPKDQV